MTLYACFAPHYDEAMGRSFFGALRRAFDRLVVRYGLQFRDALDLGCGTGLFACHLAGRYKAQVLGIDNEPQMLAIARRDCRSCRVGFMRMDLRALALPWRFDLITANFDTLNHLSEATDVQRVLRTVAGLLRPGGHLVFDVLTPAAAGLLEGHRPRWVRLAQGRVWQSVRLIDGGRQIATRVHVTRHAVVRGSDNNPHVERLYSVVQIGAWLRQAGLVLQAVLDARTLANASVEPPRALIVARRP